MKYTGKISISISEYLDFGQLTSSSGENYTLDHQGRRVKVVDASGNTTYQIYSPANELIALADSAGTITTMFINGPGNLVLGKVPNVGTANENVEFFINDYRGDIVMETASNGETLAAHQYDVWGTPTNLYKKAGETLDFAFTGKFWNPTTKDYNLGARTYNPTIKRFLTDDNVNPELNNLKSYNPYLYANGDPVNYFDPDGNTALPNYFVNGINTQYPGSSSEIIDNAKSLLSANHLLAYNNTGFLDGIAQVFLSRIGLDPFDSNKINNLRSIGNINWLPSHSGGCDSAINSIMYRGVNANRVDLLAPQFMFGNPEFISAMHPNTEFHVRRSWGDIPSMVRFQANQNGIDMPEFRMIINGFGNEKFGNFYFNNYDNISHVGFVGIPFLRDVVIPEYIDWQNRYDYFNQ